MDPSIEEPRESRRFTGWVERRAERVVSRIVEARLDELQERARRVVDSVYENRADDLEERAVRAMRRAITDEAERIKETIEHAVAVKKREVRLSLLVLIVAALVYLALDWFV
jgi:16S rRNA C1402 N4-methylase RsmH